MSFYESASIAVFMKLLSTLITLNCLFNSTDMIINMTVWFIRELYFEKISFCKFIHTLYHFSQARYYYTKAIFIRLSRHFDLLHCHKYDIFSHMCFSFMLVLWLELFCVAELSLFRRSRHVQCNERFNSRHSTIIIWTKSVHSYVRIRICIRLSFTYIHIQYW